MKVHGVIVLLLGCVLSVLSLPSWAIWVSANSFVYFDANGNVIGQSIIGCAASPRQYEGTTSVYWREDSLNCETSSISGWQCTWLVPNIPGDVYPEGGWDCNPIVNYVQPGNLVTGEQYLPPGMTLEESCEKAPCDEADQFLGQWTTAPQLDPSDVSLPPQLR